MTTLNTRRVARGARFLSACLVGIACGSFSLTVAAAPPKATPKAAPAPPPVVDPLQDASTEADRLLAQGKPVEARAGYAAALEGLRANLGPDALAVAQAKLGALSAATAQLTLEVSELDAEVKLDGVTVGRTPLSEPLSLNPGSHQILIQKDGFIGLTQQLQLERGPSSTKLSLVPEVLTGKLRVTLSNPQSVSELLIDNRVVGLLPWEGALPVGKVQLLARNNAESSQLLEVEVERDVTKPVVLELKQNSGSLEISAAAAGVRISIDGRLKGIQNWHGPLPVGQHRLSFAREGFETQEQEIDIKANESSSVLINNWVPIHAPPPLVKPDDNQGLYFRLDLGPTFSSGSDGINQNCDATGSNARCADRPPIGGFLGVRAGYRFNWIAPEIWGLGSLSVSYVRTQFDRPTTPAESEFSGPVRREDYIFFRYGWAAGVGVRATSPTRGVSATGGVGFGVFSMSGQYGRTTTSTSGVVTPGGSVSIPSGQTASSSTVQTYAPGLLLDAGVLIGSSPGTKLFLGVMLALEFAPEHARVGAINDKKLGNDLTYNNYNTPGLDVASGTQWRFGPVLGFQFGY